MRTRIILETAHELISAAHIALTSASALVRSFSGRRALVVATLLAPAIQSATGQVIFKNSHSYGFGGNPSAVVIQVTVTRVGSNYKWEYLVTNNSFDPAPGTSNGLSGLELALPANIPGISNITSPGPGWITDCCSGEPVEWDITDSSGLGIMPGQSALFSFTSVPLSITHSTGWFHTWESNVQTDVTYYASGTGPEVPNVLSAITLVDPVPNLLSGAGLTQDTDQLASTGEPVLGVAADGVTQLLIRIPASSVNEPFTATLMNDQGAPSSSADDDGAIGPLADTLLTGGGSDTNITAVSTASGPIAFLIYRAPIDFVRSSSVTDSSLSERIVSLQVTALDTDTITPVTITIVRPPVVLIHGLWGDPSDWNTFTPLISDTRFTVSRANYNVQSVTISASTPAYESSLVAHVSNNMLGFDWNSQHVIAQIRAAVNSFKNQKGVAAVQADIVAHSMGGDISRTLPLKTSFTASDNYDTGLIHKLITVGTPHLGTPVAGDLLSDDNKCVRDLLADPSNGSRLSFSSVTVLGHTINGAVGDLVGNASGGGLSTALTNIKNSPRHLMTAMVAGTMTASQLNALACTLCHAEIIRLACKGDPLADNLTVSGWPTIVGSSSDSIVPLNSQLNGNTSAGIEMSPAIHSQGMETLDFGSPSELDPGSGIPAEVVTLLNTPVTTTGTFVSQ